MALPGYDAWATTPPDEPTEVSCSHCLEDGHNPDDLLDLDGDATCRWCVWTELSERLAALLDAPHAVTEAEARFLDEHMATFETLTRDVKIEINRRLKRTAP